MNALSNKDSERGFRALFLSLLLWSTQPHLVVFTLLFLNKGISLTQFFVIQSVGSITALVLELPTGILADRLGRKFSIVTSLALGLVCNPLFILSDNLWVLYSASFLGGLSGALRSGADEALFFDSLKAMKREDEYTRLNGKLRKWSGYTGLAASLGGGALGAINPSLAWWCWEALVALAFVSALFITEPKVADHARPDSVFSHLQESLKTVFRSHARFFVMYAVSVWLFFGTAFWFWQPYLTSIGVPVAWFGVLYALTGVAGGYGGSAVAWLERRLSAKSILLIPPLLLGLTLAGEASCPWILGALFLLSQSFASGIFFVSTDHMIHTRIESATRATVLSVKNMLSSLLFAAFSPLLGYLADALSLSYALAAMAIGVSVVGLACFLAYPRQATQ